jgi:alkylated DNA repair dioxygenase AlkB
MLFNDFDASQNLLPHDGEVYCHQNFLTFNEAKFYFDNLLAEIAWQQDEVIMFGKKITTSRKVAWYATENIPYTYSKTTKQSLPFISSLATLLQKIEATTNAKFNACLLNLYHNGNEGMGWHADDEKPIVTNSCIASLSLGAQRKFAFKHKSDGKKIELQLHNGSLLSMQGATQQNWLHQLPKTTKVLQPRINLTFRLMHV